MLVSAENVQQFVTSTESCMFHPGTYSLVKQHGTDINNNSELVYLPDLGYVGGGMPTTDQEAREFAANVADPTRHLRT